ncbi:translesion error-prone DNA polymerase V autoproteolytic subunit [Flavobacterium sp. J49]|uniref:LexA family protein n=1 Tax=Flavobacterium sp. J49 TaxID=2718534 RepID=UPI00159377C2|nr:translesion error-prone DNA polymerase V autoproteolytic subunit [Flavobacterium sp. J49]MBF6641683.1 translesion error-prone DNA polymerase V autoproteolytic subunit [Flavobacterium sp. J49]NIC02930.1 translesion error-prone DNA polymerase V autoproteolytic subunit [Flavobacterium sp. J49]
MSKKSNLTFFKPDFDNSRTLPYFEGGIKAGFPSPAADFEGTQISLDKVLVKNFEATFYAKADGTSMIGAGIDDGDIMVIDRSIEPIDGKIAVCLIDGEFTVKRIKVEKDALYLMPENKAFQPIKIAEDNKLVIWGIVTYVIKSV